MIRELAIQLTDKQILKQHVQLGVEIEKHRIDERGNLSVTPFPNIDQCDTTNNIKREFVVSQTEFVSPKMCTASDICDFMTDTVQEFHQVMPEDEILWPFSMPPHLPQDRDEIPISKEPADSYQYRLESRARHELGKSMNTGVHVNVSLTKPAMQKMVYHRADLSTEQDIYVKLAQYFVLNRWVLTYLFGASPVIEENYFLDGREMVRPIRSIRSSRFGFGNEIAGDYSSVEAYAKKIETAVLSGKLIAPREFYDSVRLKHVGSKDPADLLNGGVTHIELRTFDSNPFTVSGVSVEQLQLVQLLALYFLNQPAILTWQLPWLTQRARKMNYHVALEHPLALSKYYHEGLDLFQRLEQFVDEYDLGGDAEQLVHHFMGQFSCPELTLAGQLMKKVEDKSLVPFGLDQGKKMMDK
ncbi:hypothetical protein [Paucilactobacillus kaifaensis]|uniref:hypothetical protein n=1 Tax=Paucilactobacillus kaifaensis TaxID=2559921 RepID=UPI0010F95FC8|nr:hypothetical protein [Paucilactobacillus kaifaensis]